MAWFELSRYGWSWGAEYADTWERHPEITNRFDHTVIGIQHHILALLFLVQFDPGIPKVGTNRRTALTIMTVSFPIPPDPKVKKCPETSALVNCRLTH